VLTPGVKSRLPVLPGSATVIATGGMIPRGADAVLIWRAARPCSGAAGC
jgi:putative molybdopterin biosynthesis protein